MACSRWLRRGKFENCGEDWCPGGPHRPACRGWIPRPAILLFLGLKMAGRRLVSREEGVAEYYKNPKLCLAEK
jgi:hypothetical protein